ncbi:hypothetical protein C5N14_30675 [Micromonospora sp. MW-13]|uniref:hypothetical protein n=1 Tax=Micromonospora sp. MW-13 TaxID=2094022 RepID=UPI000EBF0EE0|nr:hypothetical protein [Micromonospora sp. MW-13]RGC65017.1 hypothetical protein C5N14_30675 [Micromonospora sp. MW-13]
MRELRRIRRRCEALLRTLDVPRPLDVHQLCAQVARLRGRPIHLLPTAFPDGTVCGLWIASDSADYLAYEQDTSAIHQEHILLHELGHLLCGHDGDDIGTGLFPTLEPATVRRMLARTNYSTAQELEAELLASLIRSRSAAPLPPGPEVESGTVGERIRRAVSHGEPGE